MRKRLIITSAVVAGILLIGGGTAVAVGYTAPPQIVEAPAPVVEEPVAAPVDVKDIIIETPAPAPVEVAPVVEAPAPVAPAPAPVAPAPAPVVEAPAAPYVPVPQPPRDRNDPSGGTCSMEPSEFLPTCKF